jgi:hypothetical protein
MAEETIIAIVAISCVFGLPILLGGITLITSHLRQVKVDEANLALKREMIERGFSADEIARVIEAGSEKKDEAEKKAAAR